MLQKPYILVFLGGLALVGLVSCGVPICVAGIGDCSAMFEKYENQPTPTPTPTLSANGIITINGVSTLSFATSATTTFTATGGNGIYNFTINPTSCGVFNSFTIGYFTARIVANCLITVTDTSNPIRTGTFSLNITN